MLGTPVISSRPRWSVSRIKFTDWRTPVDNPEPRAQYLNVVLRQIERTSLRIPRFQRHFVWTERDVLELLGSIQKGYPIGSVLTWKVDVSDDYFAGYREIPFPAAEDSVTSFEVILDGAQRLSSLFGCLRNSAADPIYEVYYDVHSKDFSHKSSLRSIEPWHIPMDSLFDSRRFLEVQSRISDLDDSDELLPRALELYSTFQDYQIPIIALSNAVLEDVVEVFRRVNSSGTPLSSVDFVRALTWRSSFDLEETFEEFAERYQATPLEGLTEDFLIRCLAITSGLSIDSRDIVQLKKLSNRAQGLASEVVAMRSALDKMAVFLDRFNITSMREVPYEIQRLLLFGIMHFDVNVSAEKIESWFWRSTFAEEHQSKPESYVTRSMREMQKGNVAPVLEVRKPIEFDLFASRPRRVGSAVTTGFDLLLRKSHPRSLLSGKPVSSFEGMHGILFSRSMLEREDGHATNTGLLANLVLLNAEDAAEWRRLQEFSTVADLFNVCQDSTGEAEAIWLSQGLRKPSDESPMDLLRQRSEELLNRVMP
ncbi:DUF262 domain-containing protein [Sinomonas atrocyanea]